MAEIHIILKAESPAEIIAIKQSLQVIASNFNKDNIKKIADASTVTNSNQLITDLFNNPLVKMKLKK